MTVAGTTSTATLAGMRAQREEASGVTIRALGLRTFFENGILVRAGTRTEIANMAVVRLDIEEPINSGIFIEGRTDSEVSQVLLATNRVLRTLHGIIASGGSITQHHGLSQLTIVGNTLQMLTQIGVIFLTGGFALADTNVVSAMVAKTGLRCIDIAGWVDSRQNTVL